MKIFNRGTDVKPAQPQAAVAAPAPAAPAPALAPPAPVAEPPAPPAPDLSAILDANVKEMSERIARLATSLEGQQQERQVFDAKIEQMEERMRKLSSLTEMISAQYNPFVGDAPQEREALPAPDVGLAAPPLAGPAIAAVPPPAYAAPAEAAPDPYLAPPVDFAPPIAAPALVAAPAATPPGLDITPPEAAWQAPAADEPARAEPGVHLWAAAPGFESSMLMLGWADMLLQSAGDRQNLLELVNYYHNLGWIGDPARDQLLGYADGLKLAEPAAAREDWRADVSVHERSLLYVEKLRACLGRRQG